MRRAIDVITVLFWASAALLAAWVMLTWVASGVRDEQSFLLFGGAAVVPATACSAFLFWQELRSNRQELRDARRESRDVPFEEGAEWTSKVAFYLLASFLSFSLSWYVLPSLLLSFFF